MTGSTDRLTGTTSPMFTGGVIYGYDVLDNLKRVKAPGRDHTYHYDGSNRLHNVTNTVGGGAVIGLGYDVRGNLANKNGQGYVFDHGNRLRSATGLESYRYDAEGRRIKATTPANAAIYSVYNKSGQLLFQRDERVSFRFQYVYLGSQLIGLRRRPIGDNTETLMYYHTDVLGSNVAITDSARNVIQRSEYEPYGRVLNRAMNNRPGFTGHIEDSLTGLTYMQQRYYDPSIGRFLSVDPVTAYEKPITNFNRYVYALNNPYKFSDPDGRDVVFSVDSNGAGGNGHTSLYFQDANGNWHRYDQGAAGDGGSSGNFGFVSGRSTQAGVSIQPVESKAVPTDGLRINTTAKQDAKIADSAARSADAHNSGEARYNLYSNNCTDAAVDVVNESGAGISVSNPATTVKPNSWISEVMNDSNAVRVDGSDAKR